MGYQHIKAPLRRPRWRVTPALQDEALSSMRTTSIGITAADAVVASSLPWPHRDPFDRMLTAQAARRGLVLASSDATILAGALSGTLDTRCRLT
jgi:PIN domain nuclease of toxin-antitoxin system